MVDWRGQEDLAVAIGLDPGISDEKYQQFLQQEESLIRGLFPQSEIIYQSLNWPGFVWLVKQIEYGSDVAIPEDKDVEGLEFLGALVCRTELYGLHNITLRTDYYMGGDSYPLDNEHVIYSKEGWKICYGHFRIPT
jgi:hypothetical protein